MAENTHHIYAECPCVCVFFFFPRIVHKRFNLPGISLFKHTSFCIIAGVNSPGADEVKASHLLLIIMDLPMPLPRPLFLLGLLSDQQGFNMAFSQTRGFVRITDIKPTSVSMFIFDTKPINEKCLQHGKIFFSKVSFSSSSLRGSQFS